MAGTMLDEKQLAELAALVDNADAANPQPADEEPEMEEAQDTDEVDAANEAVDELGEGEGEVTETPAEPDPNAGAVPAAAPAAPALPEGIESMEQLVQEFQTLRTQANQRGEEMAALREMNEQLMSIAQVLGYSRDIESVDLSVKDGDEDSKLRAMISDQFKPLIEQQQRNLRNRAIDMSWKQFGADNPDVNDFMDDIKGILKESPALYDDENGLAVAYHMARSGRYKPETALFEDDMFIEKAAQNEKIKNKVIEEYLKNVRKSGENAPASVGKGGSSVPTGRKKTDSMKDAHKAMFKMLNG